MHNIGNERDAQTILHWVRDHDSEYDVPSCVEQGSAPYQWEYVDHGSYRSVWLSPEGVAYKVDHDNRDGQCEREVRLLKEAWTKKAIKGSRLPRFSEYGFGDEVVVAIELIRGSLLSKCTGEGHYFRLLERVERYYNLCDLHNDNVIVDEDGLLVPIDFGQ